MFDELHYDNITNAGGGAFKYEQEFQAGSLIVQDACSIQLVALTLEQDSGSKDVIEKAIVFLSLSKEPPHHNF